MTTDRTPDSDREAAIRARLDCRMCNQPYHRYSTSDPEHEWNGVACINALKDALSEARAALAAAEAVTPLERVLEDVEAWADRWAEVLDSSPFDGSEPYDEMQAILAEANAAAGSR